MKSSWYFYWSLIVLRILFYVSNVVHGTLGVQRMFSSWFWFQLNLLQPKHFEDSFYLRVIYLQLLPQMQCCPYTKVTGKRILMRIRQSSWNMHQSMLEVVAERRIRFIVSTEQIWKCDFNQVSCKYILSHAYTCLRKD